MSSSSRFTTLPSGIRARIDISYTPSMLTGLPRGTKHDPRDLGAPRMGVLSLTCVNGSKETKISVEAWSSQREFCRRTVRRVLASALLNKLQLQHAWDGEYTDGRLVFQRCDRRAIFQMICPEYGTSSLSSAVAPKEKESEPTYAPVPTREKTEFTVPAHKAAAALEEALA